MVKMESSGDTWNNMMTDQNRGLGMLSFVVYLNLQLKLFAV